MAVPSGLYYPEEIPPSGIFLFNVYDDSSFLLTTISGYGNLKLFESNDLYLFKGTKLLKYTGDIVELGLRVSNMCLTSENYIVAFTDVGYGSNIRSEVRSQKEPVTVSGWSSPYTITGLRSSDAISTDLGVEVLPVLVGNSRKSASTLVYRNDPQIPVFNGFVKSDSGIVIQSIMTDLESTQ